MNAVFWLVGLVTGIGAGLSLGEFLADLKARR